MHSPRRLVLLLVLCAPLVFAGLANHGFWLSDEPFVAEVSREMAASGDFVTPHLNGEPFLEKPPLHYAAVAASYEVLGLQPLAARLPSALASLLTILATYLLGRRLFDETTAAWGALALPTVYLFFYADHYCLVDPSLALFVTLAFLAGSYAFGEDRAPWALPLAYGAAGLAFLAKGPIGPLLVGPGLAAFALVRRDAGFFRRRGHLLGILLFALVVGPWLVGLWREGGAAYYREAFLSNSLGRFFSLPALVPGHDPADNHQFPLWDYLISIPSDFMPWTPLLLLAVLSAPRRHLNGRRENVAGPHEGTSWGEAFLWMCFLSGFVLLSLARTKRGMYALPLHPLLALLVAREARRLVRDAGQRMGLGRILLLTQGALLGVVTLAVPAAYLFYSRQGAGWPSASALVTALALVAAGLGALALQWRALRAGDLAAWFRVCWGQAFLGFVALAILCFPLLDSQKSFDPFFRRAVALETARGRTPRLYTDDENVTGLAGLFFQAPAPPLERTRLALERLSPGESMDLLTDQWGLDTLKARRDSECRVLEKQLLPGGGVQRTLFLVSYRRLPGREWASVPVRAGGETEPPPPGAQGNAHRLVKAG